jgi:hypothetical protein
VTSDLCRQVFGVELDRVRTAAGDVVAVFHRHASRPRTLQPQGPVRYE